MKKDTERADEIRAMKKAWEEAEPGRAVKAMQSRLKYLNSRMVTLTSHIHWAIKKSIECDLFYEDNEQPY